MTRYTKRNGKYQISGRSFSDLSGSRAQVWHGTAYKTPGGLTKNNLMKNKSGRIVSKSKHTTAKRENRLVKHGFGTKKGKFGFVKLDGHSRSRGRGRKSSKRSKRMRGGAPYGNDFSPASFSGSGIDGQGITDYGGNSTNVQLAAGMAGGRRRRKGGAPYGNNFSPASFEGSGIDGQGITDYGGNSTNVQLAAGMAGGRRRRRRGGSGIGFPLSPAPVKGLSGSENSINVQLQAGMGGSRRRRRRGGTTKHSLMQGPTPLNRALGAS